MNIKLSDINSAIGTANSAMTTVNAALPILMAAYNVLKAIWLRTNPGKSEADYLGYLQASSLSNVDDSAAILIADGYVQQADRSWKKVAPPA